MRRLFDSLLPVMGVCLALALVFVFLGIWSGDDRFGLTGAVLLVTGIATGIARGFWGDDPPPTRLSRAVRKELRAAEQQIYLRQRINEAEATAGLPRTIWD